MLAESAPECMLRMALLRAQVRELRPRYGKARGEAGRRLTQAGEQLVHFVQAWAVPAALEQLAGGPGQLGRTGSVTLVMRHRGQPVQGLALADAVTEPGG